MKNNEKKRGRSTENTRSAYDERDLFDEDVIESSSKTRRVSNQKTKKRSLVLPTLILVLSVTLVSLLGVVYLNMKGGKDSKVIEELKTVETAQFDEYSSLINNAVKPEGWDDNAFNTLKDAALAAYDRSLLDQIELAQNGDENAIAELKEKDLSASAQPDAVANYRKLFGDLNAVPAYVANMAAGNPAMAEVVVAYANGNANTEGNPGAQLNTDTLQDLKTSNPDWAFVEYGNGPFVQTGAAPTAIASVFSYLLKDAGLNPIQVANFARDYGYDVAPVRDGDSLFSACALQFGVPMNPLPGYATQIGEALSLGDIVIAQQGDNENPHFIVLSGLDENGNWIMQDPTSAEGPHSVSPDDIIDSITAGYAYWVE